MQHTSSLPAPARNSKSVCALNIKCQFSLRNLIKGSAQPEYHANLATLNCRTTIENLLQHSILSEFASESHPSNDREYAKNIFIKRLLCIGIALAGLSAHLDEFGRAVQTAHRHGVLVQNDETRVRLHRRLPPAPSWRPSLTTTFGVATSKHAVHFSFIISIQLLTIEAQGQILHQS